MSAAAEQRVVLTSNAHIATRIGDAFTVIPRLGLRARGGRTYGIAGASCI